VVRGCTDIAGHARTSGMVNVPGRPLPGSRANSMSDPCGEFLPST
jgi:hypothetical protein